MIDAMSATAGKIPFSPPEKPAMKWGSTNPSTIRRSACTYSRFRKTVSPSRDFPAGSIVAGSCAVWLTTR